MPFDSSSPCLLTISAASGFKINLVYSPAKGVPAGLPSGPRFFITTGPGPVSGRPKPGKILVPKCLGNREWLLPPERSIASLQKACKF